ncbi:MAG: PAS domain-containing sensor histidine kinase [Phycisphaerae bacterium]|nr:PAS domain-containing sensor histidine kinase [Gemmatimonadaceae bacterium]
MSRERVDTSTRQRTVLVWARWLGLFAAMSYLFSVITSVPGVRISHGLLLYLLLIIGVSRETRRWLSFTLVVCSYLAVDWFFIPPVHSFGSPTEFDWFILIGFAFTGIVITGLVSTLQNALRLAQARATEIEQLGAQQLELEREAARTRDMRETEEMKNALIASIAHDLRSPITTMKMLADPGYEIHPALALRRISDEADRINRYLTTMRHFSAVGTTGRLMNVESHVVDDLIGIAVSSYAGVLRGREVIVHSGIEGEVLLVRCDLTLSLQVLGNLLQNAARHSDAPAPIELWAEREGSQVRMVVADRGPGVLENEVELIFRPRQRGSAGDQRGGEGMGLAIARTFARAQLGDVEYRARAGGGAEFSFLLPPGTEPVLQR